MVPLRSRRSLKIFTIPLPLSSDALYADSPPRPGNATHHSRRICTRGRRTDIQAFSSDDDHGRLHYRSHNQSLVSSYRIFFCRAVCLMPQISVSMWAILVPPVPRNSSVRTRTNFLALLKIRLFNWAWAQSSATLIGLARIPSWPRISNSG